LLWECLLAFDRWNLEVRLCPFPEIVRVSMSFLCLLNGARLKLTDLNISVTADLLERAHRSIRIVTADISHLGAQVLLDVDGVLVLVDGAEEAARGSGDGELREREESRGENSTAEHFECGVEERLV
jgi:hypothetical protein